MSYQTQRISGNQVRIDFTVSHEDFEEAMKQAYVKNRGRINVPGFRKGKAPRKLMETMFGESVFYDDAFDLIFPALYDEAVQKEDLFAVDQPDIKIDQIGSGKELQFSATVYVKPEVTLGEYKGLSGVRHLHPIPEEDIEHRISHDMEKVTIREDIGDRALQSGDIVNLDYKGSVDSVPFSGGEAKGQELTLGSGAFIPGFEEQLIGMKPGEEKTITVTFPEEYQSKELAGKEAQFDIRVNSAVVEVKPELNDDFAQDVSEHQTYAQYREAIVKDLEEARNKQAEVHLDDHLIQEAVDAADCDIPEAMISRQTDRLVRDMKLRMLYQGLRFEDYLKYTNSTEADIRNQFRQDAINGVKADLVIEAIGKQEQIEASDEETVREITRHAEEMKRDPEEYKLSLNEDQMENYKELVISRKVVDLIKEHAKITVHEGGDEPVNAQEVLAQVEDALPQEEEPKDEKPAKKRKSKPAAKKDETPGDGA